MADLPETVETVVWDFNGTLIDDVAMIVDAVNVQLAQRGLPLLTVRRYRDVFRFPVEEYYRVIGLDPEAEPIAELSAEFHDLYLARLIGSALHDGIEEALSVFEEAGAQQFVLSAMEEGRLRRSVERLGIADRFTAVYGLAHLEGDSKLTRGRDLVSDFRIAPEKAILIGDTNHDADVARALGMTPILVANGHQSARRLRATGRRVLPDARALVAAWRDGRGA